MSYFGKDGLGYGEPLQGRNSNDNPARGSRAFMPFTTAIDMIYVCTIAIVAIVAGVL